MGEDKMNHQQSVSEKARGALRMVLDENKRAAAEETAELDKLFKAKIAKERSRAAEIARGAAKDLSAATQKMYAEDRQGALARRRDRPWCRQGPLRRHPEDVRR